MCTCSSLQNLISTCMFTAIVCVLHNVQIQISHNNSNLFCANILENQAKSWDIVYCVQYITSETWFCEFTLCLAHMCFVVFPCEMAIHVCVCIIKSFMLIRSSMFKSRNDKYTFKVTIQFV